MRNFEVVRKTCAAEYIIIEPLECNSAQVLYKLRLSHQLSLFLKTIAFRNSVSVKWDEILASPYRAFCWFL